MSGPRWPRVGGRRSRANQDGYVGLLSIAGGKKANSGEQAGIMENRRVFLIAVFASLGGLCVSINLVVDPLANRFSGSMVRLSRPSARRRAHHVDVKVTTRVSSVASFR